MRTMRGRSSGQHAAAAFCLLFLLSYTTTVQLIKLARHLSTLRRTLHLPVNHRKMTIVLPNFEIATKEIG